MSTDTAMSDQARTMLTMRLQSSVAAHSFVRPRLWALLGEVQAKAESAAADDWDGEGGLAVEAATVRYAMHFLHAVAQLPALPSVEVDRDGELVFDWDSEPGQTFSVAVARDGTLTYVGLFGSARMRGVDTLNTGFPAAVMIGAQRAAEARERNTAA